MRSGGAAGVGPAARCCARARGPGRARRRRSCGWGGRPLPVEAALEPVCAALLGALAAELGALDGGAGEGGLGGGLTMRNSMRIKNSASPSSRNCARMP